jgi:hypothetical protein
MFCECVWQEIDYRNRLLLAGCDPDCLCDDCMDAYPYFYTHPKCEA